MARQEIVAMLLAGGQGSRLGVLTEYIAKPAVPFGSRYRIIDFPLSNCTNSGIETVGVLTQYQPLELNSYVGNGHSWDLDRSTGGLSILPPYQRSRNSEWYKGTANAIYQNIHYLDNYDPNYVLILSGDHIYKMNYEKMLRFHIENNADATIAVLEVPWEEASRFGIMNTDEEGRIVEFEEKPKKPKSNLASMGIYIFSWPKLRAKLIEDENNPKSSNDFGKNIIPAMLAEGMKMMAWQFSGYWKDVGTISSLWEANMDLLDSPDEINLFDRGWRIYGRNPNQPPHYISENAVVEQSVMTDGCEIYGTVRHSVLSNGVIVEKGAEVIDSILMPGAIVRKGAKLEKCIIGMNAEIGAKTVIGPMVKNGLEQYLSPLCSDDISLVQGNLKIRPDLKIAAGSMIGHPENGQEDEAVAAILKDYR